MMRWIVKPLERVGDIEFGMKRQQLREKLGAEYKEFRKTPDSVSLTDDYGDFHVFYNENDQVEAVEIFDGIELSMDEIVVFPIEFTEIENLFKGIIKDEYGYTDVNKSIGISVDDGKVESILFGNKGYYE